MLDYKDIKEAFVANNPGTSILHINTVNLIGLTSYLLASSIAHYRDHSDFFADYIASVLLLLCGQTVFAKYPGRYNAILVLLAGIITYITPKRVPTLGKGRFRSTTGTSRADVGETGYSSSEEDENPIAAKSVPIPPSRPSGALSTLKVRVRHRTLSQDGQILDRLSPLAELPTEMERRASFLHEEEDSSRSSSATGIISRSDSPHTIDIPPSPNPDASSSTLSPRLTPSSGNRLPQQRFLSVYRAHMMIMTTIAILAVDFPVFPRGFGKCEDFGTSLMDIGVGSFVFSQGIISALPLLKPSKEKPILLDLLGAIRKCLPILLLGLIRVLMIKGSEYPEHVTEYGVHWNFFFTLGLMPLFGTLAIRARRWGRYTKMALILSGGHQVILSLGGVQSWVMSDRREGLIGMNKEGIVSFTGYFAIFLLGLDLGHYLLPPDPYYFKKLYSNKTDASSTIRRMKRKSGELALVLLSYATIWWVCLAVLRVCGMEVSRRLANLPYVLWTAAFNTTFLLGYLCIEMLYEKLGITKDVTPLLEAYNKNGLIIFLAANIGTGIVNLSTQTMFASDGKAMLLLVMYTMGLSGLAWTLRRTRLRL